jgi:bifunctional non-homologous end joining protein LigD
MRGSGWYWLVTILRPLLDRKNALRGLLKAKGRKDGPLLYSDHVMGQGPAFFRQACAHHLEGIMSKPAEAPWQPDRSAWLKVKCELRQEFVVGGWVRSEAQGRTLSSLLVGFWEGNGRARRLVFAGKLGTGFTMPIQRDLLARLAKLGPRPAPAFTAVPREYLKNAVWVEPRLVVEGQYRGWTTDKLLRQASFKGVREDKRAKDVRIFFSFDLGLQLPKHLRPPKFCRARG